MAIIEGSNFNDVLDGTQNADIINGFDGNDVIHAGAGNDRIHGGAGNDIIFSEGGDDDIWGGAGNDQITGTAESSVWVYYDEDPGRVSVNLRTGIATDGWGGIDTLSHIYGAVGSAYADTLTADGLTSSVFFEGGGGDDQIRGAWGNDLLSGGTGNDVIDGGDGITGVTDTSAGTIYRLYQATFKREPEAAGLEYWLKATEAGTSALSMAAQFVGSPEFQATYGALNNSQFVELMYRNVLGRPPEPAGLSYWVNALNSGTSRASALLGFADSPEFKAGTRLSLEGYMTSDYSGENQAQVFRMYQAVFDRQPDATGFVYWLNKLDGRTATMAEMASGFVASPEFQTAYGALNNTDFVNALYLNVLGRPAEPQGLAYWVERLGNGTFTRANVVAQFSDSPEFRENMRVPFKDYMESGLGSWSDQLVGGAGDDVLVGGRGADIFSFAGTQTGNDQVYGLEGVDTLRFGGFSGISSAADVIANLTQVGQNVVFSSGGESVTFRQTTIAQVTQSTILVVT